MACQNITNVTGYGRRMGQSSSFCMGRTLSPKVGITLEILAWFNESIFPMSLEYVCQKVSPGLNDTMSGIFFSITDILRKEVRECVGVWRK